ncbi:MAG: GGDEF domain-containing protein [Pseudomonadota bacterium]
MKIDKSGGAKSAQSIGVAQSDSARRRPEGAAAPTEIADQIVLLGVPEAEMTEKVRAALVSLLDEVRDLRAQLEDARIRVSELETIADRDSMLDILNRRAFARELDRALAMIDRYDMSASLVFIDLNDLKRINDQLGHGAGDAALAHVARFLSDNVRQTDIVARLGGDEFALLLLQADQAVAAAKAKAIAAMIAAAPVEWKGRSFEAGVSWGAVEIRKGVSAQEAMNLADEAMYQAKKLK